MTRRIIITGTPRSGTRYMARLLNELGVPCAHEKVFTPESSWRKVADWLDGPEEIRAEASWFVWPWLSQLVHDATVVHLLRDPWATIDSLARRCPTLTDEGERVLKRFWLTEVAMRDAKPTARAALFWEAWNDRVAAFPHHHRVNVEAVSRRDLETITGRKLALSEYLAAHQVAGARAEQDTENERAGGDPWKRRDRKEVMAELSPYMAMVVYNRAAYYGYRLDASPAPR